jgi:hypothetical protein
VVVIEEKDREMCERILAALALGGLKVVKVENNRNNIGLTPELTLAVMLGRTGR